MIRKLGMAAAITGAVMAIAAPSALAGPEEYLGEIVTVGFNSVRAARWRRMGACCRSIRTRRLFSLLGTMYGGDGRTTFALPDLRGRTIIGAGQGPGLTNRPIGQKGGIEK